MSAGVAILVPFIVAVPALAVRSRAARRRRRLGFLAAEFERLAPGAARQTIKACRHEYPKTPADGGHE